HGAVRLARGPPPPPVRAPAPRSSRPSRSFAIPSVWRVACANGLLLGVALQAKLDQAVEQLRIGDPAGLPQLGIHADLGEAWHGVDLVEVDRAGVFVEEEIYPRQPAQVERDERFHRHAPDRRRGLLWDLRRNGEARGVV